VLPTAVQVEKYAGTASYEVPQAGIVVSQFFQMMEANKERAGIIDWGISQTTLEDVFLRIAKTDESVAESMNQS
jgi:hypothetical protein